MDTHVNVAALLRGLPMMAGPLPSFDIDTAPDAPGELFVRWLQEAAEAKVQEPHVVTLSTADATGRPSSRVLMLRGVDVPGAGWLFASRATSRKGRELARNPHAALCAYWPPQGRQVLVTGTVEVMPPDATTREFLGRTRMARLAVLTGQQSESLSGPEEYEAAWREADGLLAEHPEIVPADYRLYLLRAEDVEFWQGDADRRHVRLRYTRRADGIAGWNRQRLWP